jgi:hypothetical protein
MTIGRPVHVGARVRRQAGECVAGEECVDLDARIRREVAEHVVTHGHLTSDLAIGRRFGAHQRAVGLLGKSASIKGRFASTSDFEGQKETTEELRRGLANQFARVDCARETEGGGGEAGSAGEGAGR